MISRALITSYLLLFTFSASALTDSWSIDVRQHTAVDRTYKQGETWDMRPTLRDGFQPLDLTGCTAVFYWYTNSVDNLWWTNTASVVTPRSGLLSIPWTPAMDTGAAAYPYWVGLWTSGATSPLWRCTGTLRLLPSPGFTPNALVPPVRTLDFGAITVANAPWLSASAWQSGSNALASALQILSTNTAAQITAATGGLATAASVIVSTGGLATAASVIASTGGLATAASVIASTGGLASAESVSALSSLRVTRWYDPDNTNKWATLEGSNIVVREVAISGTNYSVVLSEDFLDTLIDERPAWTSNDWPFVSGSWVGAVADGILDISNQGEWSSGTVPLSFPATLTRVIDALGTATVYQHIVWSTNTGPRYYLSTNVPPAELQNLDALQGWLNNLFYSKAASDARYANASVTNAPSWEIYTNATGLVTVTNHLETPIFIHATGAVSIAVSGLRSPLPIVLGVRGFSSLSFPGAYIVGGGSAQTNMSNYFICATLGTNTLVTPYTCTED